MPLLSTIIELNTRRSHNMEMGYGTTLGLGLSYDHSLTANERAANYIRMLLDYIAPVILFIVI